MSETESWKNDRHPPLVGMTIKDSLSRPSRKASGERASFHLEFANQHGFILARESQRDGLILLTRRAPTCAQLEGERGGTGHDLLAIAKVMRFDPIQPRQSQ